MGLLTASAGKRKKTTHEIKHQGAEELRNKFGYWSKVEKKTTKITYAGVTNAQNLAKNYVLLQSGQFQPKIEVLPVVSCTSNNELLVKYIFENKTANIS